MFRNKLACISGVYCLLAATCLSAQTRQPAAAGSGFFGGPAQGTTATNLTTIPKVQEELGLTAEQKKQLDELRNSIAEKRRAAFAELQKRYTELNVQEEADSKKLLDEKQGARLEQIRLQREGISALSRTEIMDKLELNAEQRDKVAKLMQEYRRISPFFGTRDRNTVGSRTSNAEYTENREKKAAEIVAVLTADQKAKWDGMLGAKFEFPSSVDRERRSSAPIASFQITARSRAFELGQNGRSSRETTRGLQFSFTLLGPVGPFRYQTTIETLALTDEQKKQITELGVEDAKAVEQVGKLPEAEKEAKLAEVTKSAQEKLDKILTDDQKAKLKQLLTAPASERRTRRPAE